MCSSERMESVSKKTEPFQLEDGQRIMFRCATGYIVASATAGALGFAGIGDLSLSAVVLLLLVSALLLAAGLLCTLLATLETR